jgi:hypothetical protein
MWGLNIWPCTNPKKHMGFAKFINHVLYVYVFKILLYAMSYVNERSKNIFILDIDDQNTAYIFALKGTQATSLKLGSSMTSLKCLAQLDSALEESVDFRWRHC